jgi:mannan endo-1,4-beta-mannosidase
MLMFQATRRHGISLGGLAFLLSFSISSYGWAAPIGTTVVLQSKSTNNYVVTWGKEGAIEVHASAKFADRRADIAVVDAGNGYVALRSIGENKYWIIQDSTPDVKVYCSSSGIVDATLFTWIDNADGTVALKSKVNGKYLSVVQEDTVITPDYSSIPANSDFVITPQMRLPYTATFYVLHASASSIGDREKFTTTSAALKKTNATAANPTRGFKVLTFLYNILGKQAVAGIHNKEPNSLPMHASNWMYQQTGVYPGLYSADFQFQAIDQTNRGIMIDTAIAQWKKGAIINLNYHMCSILTTESCAWDPGVGGFHPSATQFTQMLTDGAALNDTLKARLQHLAPWFQKLKDQGVEVLFRPWHEMNQSFFWWGGFTGTNGTAKLFQLTRDYMEKTLGITNIIWVWNVQDLNGINGWTSYDPGSSYYDIMSVDVYSGSFSTSYNGAMDICGDKPLGVGECYRMPTSAELSSQTHWAYFCRWDEDNPTTQSQADMKSILTAGNVLSLNEMPGWGTTMNRAQAEIKANGGQPMVSVNAAAGQVRFMAPQNGRLKISLHNAKGQLVMTIVEGQFSAGAHTERFATGALRSGIYFVRLLSGTHESFGTINAMN